ncbi:MAG: DUF748 domain-containing protein, partial [Candidatus Omnitrophica bacterium]|nr:DUF748 domain-containing protein [Candidatus Omnitrophota bacterium]
MIDSKKFKRPLLLALTVLVVGVIALFSSIPFLVRSQYLEQMVSQAVKTQLGYAPSFGQFRISFFPTPVLHITNFELKPMDETSEIPLIAAERATFRPSVLSWLLGKSELAHMALSDADIHYTWRDETGKLIKTISVQDASLDFWNIRSNHPIRFKLQGKFLSDSENIALSGTFQTNFKGFHPKDFASKIQVSIGPIELPRLSAWWGTSMPVRIESGTFFFSGQMTKLEGNVDLEVKGVSNVQGLIYQIPPEPTLSKSGDYQAKFQAHVDLESGTFVLKETSLVAPFGGPFEIEAKVNIFKWVADEIFIKTKSLRLEALPQYLTFFEKTLPVNLGFSGESQLDFFAKGDSFLFSSNLRIDFTKTTLTYSKYFSKSSGVPLFLEVDMKLGGGRMLRGDFSLEFESALLKGSLVALDLVTGEGEMTILTNKFNIDGWEQYFPPLKQFQLAGGIKVLTSFKGNFSHLDQARLMGNLSLDGLQATASNGAEVKNLNGSVDFGPLDSELKGVRFEIGTSQFLAEGKMFKQPETRWLIGFQAPKIEIHDFISQLRKINDAVLVEGEQLDWNGIEESVKAFVPAGESLEQVDAQLAFSKGRMIIPHLRFNVFGGAVSSHAVFDYSNHQVPASVIELELERLSFARMQPADKKPIVNGNLFGVATLTSEGPLDTGWLDRLKGKGSLSVTNGEFHTLDILGGLGEIAELASLGSFKTGVTRFNDIRGDFQVENKKLQTENLLLVSNDFQVEAAGGVGFGGDLNFRLSVYLAPSLG